MEHLFGGKENNAYLCQCVFHSIRFKVNKGLGHSGDPFFISNARLQVIIVLNTKR